MTFGRFYIIQTERQRRRSGGHNRFLKKILQLHGSGSFACSEDNCWTKVAKFFFIHFLVSSNLWTADTHGHLDHLMSLRSSRFSMIFPIRTCRVTHFNTCPVLFLEMDKIPSVTRCFLILVITGQDCHLK